MAAWTLKSGWFLINYDTILDNNMGGTMFSVMVETYSTSRKAMKENQEHTSGDY